MNFHKQILRATGISMMNYNQKKDLAKDPNTAPEILEQLATDKEYWIRYCVASNPNIPQKSLELLATDEGHYVRHLVATNPNTPQKALQQLATDEKSYVRRSVLHNPNSNQIIERLVFMTNYLLDSSDE